MERGVPIGIAVTTGNEADVQLADVISWMADDPDTRVIMVYMEGCRDGERLRRALAKAHAARKPVVVVKVGRTALGAQAARSHTAALAGDDAVYDALFRQYGVYRARDIEEFFNVAQGAALAGLARNDRLALFTVSGGVGAFMADEASSIGLDVAELPMPAQQEILALVPFAAPRNPIDITGQISNDRTLIDRATRIVLDAVRDYQGNYRKDMDYDAEETTLAHQRHTLDVCAGVIAALKNRLGLASLSGIVYSITEIPVDLIRQIVDARVAELARLPLLETFLAPDR
jgi:acyl-CoA synthetase (NDP forming)